jgi:hypothetical protein
MSGSLRDVNLEAEFWHRVYMGAWAVRRWVRKVELDAWRRMVVARQKERH